MVDFLCMLYLSLQYTSIAFSYAYVNQVACLRASTNIIAPTFYNVYLFNDLHALVNYRKLFGSTKPLTTRDEELKRVEAAL